MPHTDPAARAKAAWEQIDPATDPSPPPPPGQPLQRAARSAAHPPPPPVPLLPAPRRGSGTSIAASGTSLGDSATLLDPDGADGGAFAAGVWARLPDDLPAAASELIASTVAGIERLCLEIGVSRGGGDVGVEEGESERVVARLWQDCTAAATKRLSDLQARRARAVSAVSALRARRLTIARRLGSDGAPAEEDLGAAVGPLASQHDALVAGIATLQAGLSERLAQFELLRSADARLRADCPAVQLPGLGLEADLGTRGDLSCQRLQRLCEQCDHSRTAAWRALCEAIAAQERACGVEWDRLRASAGERAGYLATLPQAEQESELPPITPAALSRSLQQQQGGDPGAVVGMPGALQRHAELQAKVDALHEEVLAQLGQQVRETKSLLHSLWADYYELTKDGDYAPDRIGDCGDRRATVRDFPDAATDVNLALIESEVLQMEGKLQRVRQVTDLLRRRDEIVAARRAMEAAAADKERLLSKSRNMAAQLLQEEKTRTAVKRDLPRIEKQLHGFAVEWQETTGQPFNYQGRPLLEQLAEDPAAAPAPRDAAGRRGSAEERPGAALPSREPAARRGSAEERADGRGGGAPAGPHLAGPQGAPRAPPPPSSAPGAAQRARSPNAPTTPGGKRAPSPSCRQRRTRASSGAAQGPQRGRPV